MPQFTLSLPNVIASDGTNLYVSNTEGLNTTEILKIAPGGTITSLAGSTTAGDADGQGAVAQFNGIQAMVYVSSLSLLYIIENTVLRTVTLGGLVTTLTLTGIPFGSDSTGLTWDGNDTLYISQYDTKKIIKVTLSTNVVSELLTLTAPASPGQLAFGGGSLYVVDADNINVLYQINPSTLNITTLSTTNGIHGMTYLSGSLYFIDNLNNVEILTGSGSIIAGNSDVNGGYANGNGTAAAFNGIFYITSLGSNLYVSDYYNNAVRQINPNSPYAVTTYAIASISEPTNITSSATDTSVTISWSAPTTTNGNTITGYYLFNNCDANFAQDITIVSEATTTFTFTGLSSGTEYSVVISAVSSTIIGACSANDNITTTGGGGGAGDPYVTTFSKISYKLPTMDAPVRYFQTMELGKLLTVNAQLKTVEREEMSDDTFRSMLTLKNKMSAKQFAVLAAKLAKPETLCFFERISVQHGEQRLVVNLWNSRFELVENTLRCGVEKVNRPDLLLKAGGIYNGYTAQTLKLTIGKTAVFLSTFNSPMVRNGIYIESRSVKGGNGVIVNALSERAMTLASLDSTEPVATRDSLRAVSRVETFIDHEGVRSRNVITYK